MKLGQNEKLIRESKGNFRPDALDPFNAFGGRWFLTNTRLHFEGNFMNPSSLEESIRLERITSIESRHNDFISAKINLFLSNGAVAQMVVPNRKLWVADILNAMKGLKENPGQPWDWSKALNVATLEKPQGWFTKVMIRILIAAAIVAMISFILQQLLNS